MNYAAPVHEAGVIGYLLSEGYRGSPTLPPEVADLPPDAFVDPRLRDMFAAMVALAAAGSPCTDSTWVLSWLSEHKRPLPDLEWLINLAGSAGPNFPGYVAEVRRKWHLRSIKQRLYALAESDGDDPEQLLTLLRQVGTDLPVKERWISYSWNELRHLPPAETLIGPAFLGPGDFLLFAGPPKIGKSYVLAHLMAHLCLGRTWHGMTVDRPLTIAMLQLELRGRRYGERIRRLNLLEAEHDALSPHIAITERGRADLRSGSARRSFAEHMKRKLGREPDIFGVDPLSNVYTGENENDNAQMAECCDYLRLWQEELGSQTAMIVVHHTRKQGKDDEQQPFDIIRGATSLRGLYDTGIVMLSANPDDPEERKRKIYYEIRNGEQLPPLTIEWSAGDVLSCEPVVRPGARRKMDLSSRRDALLDLLSVETAAARHHSSNSLAVLAEERGVCSYEAARRMIAASIEGGTMQMTDRRLGNTFALARRV